MPQRPQRRLLHRLAQRRARVDGAGNGHTCTTSTRWVWAPWHQFVQAESRQVFGGGASQSFATPFGGFDSTTTIGTSLRVDRLDPVGLYQGLGGQRSATFQESQVRQSLLGLYAENSTAWTPTFRTLMGARYDRMEVDVRSSIADNTGQRTADLARPKLSFILGPWSKTGISSTSAAAFTATMPVA